MIQTKAGRIVWHDLFTTDMQASKSFYKRVAGWRYVTEHATDFAWGGGEKDFVLAQAGDEAGAGFVEQPRDRIGDWVPYVETPDVDAAAALAVELGGTVIKAPFEVPGVGRNCLLCDPLGALIGVCFSRHSFPAPTRQFGAECYLTQSNNFPMAFYRQLFNWNAQPADCSQDVTQTLTLRGHDIALRIVGETHSDKLALWVPGIRVDSLSDSLHEVSALGGSVINPLSRLRDKGHSALVRDLNGALSFLMATSS